MQKYIVKSPVKLEDGIHQEGEAIEVDEMTAAELLALGALEEATAAALIDPTDPAERQAAILEAIDGLDKANKDNWLNDGRPDAGILSGVLGWKISAAERDSAWKAVHG